MKNKRIIAVFLSLLITVIIAVPVPVYAEERAVYEILFELDTGKILFAQNANTPVPVGMMNKLMTVLAASRETEAGRLSLDKTVYAPVGVREEKGASVWLEPGDAITVEELYKSIIIGNANDAALTLAVAAFGSEEKYVKKAAEIAAELGIKNTSFTNAAGYRDPEMQISTAADIARIVSEISKIEFIAPLFVSRLEYVRDGDAQLVNTNKMARSYNGCIGYKYTSGTASGHTLAVGAESGGNRFGAVLLGYPDDTKIFTRAAKMLDAAFETYTSYVPKPPEDIATDIRVKNGYGESVSIAPANAGKYVIKKNQQGNFETRIILPEFVYAPVKAGQTVGEVHYYLEGEFFCKVPIVASADVEGVTFSGNLAIIVKSIFSFE